MALSEDQRREEDEQDARRAQSREIAHAVYMVDGIDGLSRAGCGRLYLADDVQRLRHLHDGGEEAEAQTGIAVAVDQIAEEGAHGGLDHGGRAVEHHVHRGQDQDVPRQHPAEAGHAVEGDIAHHDQAEPGADVRAVHPRDAGIAGQQNQEDQQVCGQHRHKARDDGGEEGRLALHGQGVDHAAGPGVVEVAQHPHGDHRSGGESQEGEHTAGVEDRAVDAGVEGRVLGEVLRDDGRELDRPDEDQQRQPQDPDGPEAPQQVQAEALVKAGCS